MKKIMLTETDLHNIIKESVEKVLNEGQYDDNPIKKWVYWGFNYHDPNEWMGIFEGAPQEHFMKKFDACYRMYGSNGAMNAFFVELDANNQQKLIDYVMNNY